MKHFIHQYRLASAERRLLNFAFEMFKKDNPEDEAKIQRKTEAMSGPEVQKKSYKERMATYQNRGDEKLGGMKKEIEKIDAEKNQLKEKARNQNADSAALLAKDALPGGILLPDRDTSREQLAEKNTTEQQNKKIIAAARPGEGATGQGGSSAA